MSRFFEAMKRRILYSATWGTTIVGSWLACGAVAAGTPPASPEAVAGQWELALDQTSLKCRLALRIEPTSTGARLLALPYGCRKAFPILADAQGWAIGPDGRVALLDAAGIALLRFTAESTQRLTASGPRDEIYRLTSAQALATTDDAPPRRAVERLQVATKAAAPQRNVRPGDLSGRYAVLREGGKDTGCMLTLDDKTPAKGGSKAFLAPACRDQGIVIFDPVGWRVANGRLVLTARKGHSTELDLQADGTWMKDPKEGKSLGLKKL